MWIFKRRRKPVKELMIIDGTANIIDATDQHLERLKKIIRNSANTIGDITWTNRSNEHAVVLLFLTTNRLRIGNIYIVTDAEATMLFRYISGQVPQSI